MHLSRWILQGHSLHPRACLFPKWATRLALSWAIRPVRHSFIAPSINSQGDCCAKRVLGVAQIQGAGRARKVFFILFYQL